MFASLTQSSNCLGKHSITCTINSKSVCVYSKQYLFVFWRGCLCLCVNRDRFFFLEGTHLQMGTRWCSISTFYWRADLLIDSLVRFVSFGNPAQSSVLHKVLLSHLTCFFIFYKVETRNKLNRLWEPAWNTVCTECILWGNIDVKEKRIKLSKLLGVYFCLLHILQHLSAVERPRGMESTRERYPEKRSHNRRTAAEFNAELPKIISVCRTANSSAVEIVFCHC